MLTSITLIGAIVGISISWQIAFYIIIKLMNSHSSSLFMCQVKLENSQLPAKISSVIIFSLLKKTQLVSTSENPAWNNFSVISLPNKATTM